MEITECRTYELKRGMVQPFLKLYAEKGYETQRRYLGNPVGYYYVESDSLNQAVHLWAYASLNERAARRKRLAADRNWRAYLLESAELGAILTQESKILLTAPFLDASSNHKET